MKKRMKEDIIAGVVIALMILAVPITIHYVYQERSVEVLIEKEIEKGIEVRDIENKFVVMQAIGLGGGGAGGLGAPEIKCKNASQFIELVEPNETVYIDFEIVDYQMSPSDSFGSYLGKKYWAFIENRAGIMSYVSIYSYAESPDSYWYGKAFKVKSYNSNSVVFAKGNWWIVFWLIVLIEIIILIFGKIAVNKIVYDTWDILY